MNISGEEIFFIDYKASTEKVMLYAPLRSYLAILSKENMKVFLVDSNSKVREKIIEKIKTKPLIDVKKILVDLQKVAPELSIPITDNCNLRCLYCHASAGDKNKQRSMDNSMIDAILECYFTGIPTETKEVKINFTGGGEPTYEFDRLAYAIKRANEIALDLNIRCRFTMATNGCYGQDIREYIVENFSDISLSFDGPSHIQNIHRPFKNNASSFDSVYKTAKYFYSKNFPFALRATVSDYSLSYLKEIIDFFEQNFPGVHLGLEPLILVGRAINDDTLQPPDPKMFGDELIELFKYADKKRISIANSASSEYDIVRPVFCSGVGVPNWTVLINGEIVCCAREGAPEEFSFGKLDYDQKKVFIDKKKLAQIRAMNVLNYEECVDCFAKYHCAGDCPDRRISNKLDCDSIRKVGEFILNKKINL